MRTSKIGKSGIGLLHQDYRCFRLDFSVMLVSLLLLSFGWLNAPAWDSKRNPTSLPISNQSTKSRIQVEPSEEKLDRAWLYHQGDDLSWKTTALDVSDWTLLPKGQCEWDGRNLGSGLHWFRHSVSLAGDGRPDRPWALFNSFPNTAMEIYWDGVLIGENGKVSSNKNEERLGSKHFFVIPPEFSKAGKHVIAIRSSQNNRLAQSYPGYFSLGRLDTLRNERYTSSLIMFLLAGIFLFTGFFQINNTDRSIRNGCLFFGMLFFSSAAYLISAESVLYLDLGALGFTIQKIVLAVCWIFMMALPPLYCIRESESRHPKLEPYVYITACLGALSWMIFQLGFLPTQFGLGITWFNQLISYSSLALCLWFLGDGVRRKVAGNGLMLTGMLFLTFGVALSWQFQIELGWALGLSIMVFFMILGHSKRLSLKNQSHQQSMLRSARLEIEVLKKNIQPHFLLNSLNSIIAWLEEEPKMAKRLVQALADELRMLLQVSARGEITLSEEIHLCRAHLEVMGLRQDKRYALRVAGNDLDAKIPPMVLHTLVENGLTHGYAGINNGNFDLEIKAQGKNVSLRLFNDSKEQVLVKNQGKPEGTGMRYVRTRLEEAYPGQWKLLSGPVENGWQVDLEWAAA